MIGEISHCGSRAVKVESGALSQEELDGWAQQLFQCLHVFGEGLAATFGNAIEGLRLAQHESLLDSHVPSFFELQQLGA